MQRFTSAYEALLQRIAADPTASLPGFEPEPVNCMSLSALRWVNASAVPACRSIEIDVGGRQHWRQTTPNHIRGSCEWAGIDASEQKGSKIPFAQSRRRRMQRHWRCSQLSLGAGMTQI